MDPALANMVDYIQDKIDKPVSGVLIESIEELESLIRNKVSASQHSLLSQAVNVSLLTQDLVTLNGAVSSLQQRVNELKKQLHEPCRELATAIQKLENVQKTSQTLRSVLRFLHLARQLRQQLSSSGDQAKAAELLFQLDQIRLHCGLQGIEVVDSESEWILKSREDLLKKADGLLVTGSSSQNQSDTANACQIFYHLRCLEDIVVDRICDTRHKLKQVITDSLQTLATNLATAQSASASTGLSASQRSKPSSAGASAATSPVIGRANLQEDTKSTNTIWKHFESLFQILYQKLLQVVHLQAVLRKIPLPENPEKKLWEAIEPEIFRRLQSQEKNPGLLYLSVKKREKQDQDEDDDLILFVWDMLCAHLTQQFKTTVMGQTKTHVVIQNMISDEYPRLLRIIFEFLKRLGVHQDLRPETGRILRESSSGLLKPKDFGDILRAEQEEVDRAQYNFFKDDLNRQKLIVAFDCRTLFFNKVSTSLSKTLANFPKLAPPSHLGYIATQPASIWDLNWNSNALSNFVVALKTQIASLSVDQETKRDLTPTLFEISSKIILNTIQASASQIFQNLKFLPDSDSQDKRAPLSQLHNAYIYNALYHLDQEFFSAFGDSISYVNPDTKRKVSATLEATLEKILLASFNIIEQTLINQLLQIHTVDFKSHTTPESNAKSGNTMSICSPFVTSFGNIITFLTKAVLPLYVPSTFLVNKRKALASRLAHVFLFQASMIRPLEEGGKLKLAADMAQIEFAIAMLSTLKDLPPVYSPQGASKNLDQQWRSFRSLIFKELSSFLSDDEFLLLPLSVSLLHLTSYFPLKEFSPITGYRDFLSCLRWLENQKAEESKIVTEVKAMALSYQKLVDRRGDSSYNPAFPVLQKALEIALAKNLQ